MNEQYEHIKDKGKELAKTAVAVAAATGIALGGAFGGGEELPGHESESSLSIVEMLNPDTNETDNGLAEDEKQKKSGQRRTLRAMAVGVPTAALCWWGVIALCALLPASLPGLVLSAIRWALTILAALAALSVTLKVAAPEEPLVVSLHRTYKKTLILCLLFCCGEGALLLWAPGKADQVGQWLRLLAIAGSLLFLLRKAGKKAERAEAEPEKSDRDRIRELADSVGRQR